MTDGLFISSYLLLALILIALLIFFIWRLRQADFLVKTGMPVFLRCALFWVAIVAFVCLGFSLLAVDFGLLFSDLLFADRNKNDNLVSALNLNQELIYPIPLAALFGAAFGAVFSARRLNTKPTALKRGLVGAGLGLFATIIVALLLAGSVNFSDHYSKGLWMFMVMLCSLLIPINIVLALLIPKQSLGKNDTI